MSNAYLETSRNANRIGSMVETELNEYDSENVDVVKNEVSGELEILYHSDNNSFLISKTNILAEETDLAELADILDELDVGHVW